MSDISIFWLIILALAFIFFLASLREALLLSRMHRTHPERGLYWLSAFFLLLASVFVVLGGLYLDAGRASLEGLLTPYPGARYAHERNSLVHGNTWVYVSTATPEEVRSYYQAYALRKEVPIIDDATQNGRLAFLLPSGELFLTLSTEGAQTVLYFSHAGSISITQ